MVKERKKIYRSTHSANPPPLYSQNAAALSPFFSIAAFTQGYSDSPKILGKSVCFASLLEILGLCLKRDAAIVVIV